MLWRGNMYEIVARMGPERIAPSWWNQHLLEEDDPVGRTSVGTRSFYRMADRDGRWLWVHALERIDGLTWYLSGVWA